MNQGDKIVRNTAFLMASEIGSRIISFVLIMVIARQLGESGLGAYSFIFAFLGFFSILYDLGTNTYFTKELSKDHELSKKSIGNLFSIKLTLGLVVTLVAIIVIVIIEKNIEIVLGAAIVACSFLFTNLSSVFIVIFQSMQEMKYVSIINIIQKLIVSGAGIFLLLSGYKLLPLLSIILLSQIIACIIWIILYKRKFKKIYFEIDLAFWKYSLQRSIPFLFTGAFITIYYLTGTVMLHYLSSIESVGIYNAAFRFLDSLYFIPAVIISATFPAMSHLYMRERHKFVELYKRSFSYLFIISFPIGVGTTLLAGRLLTFIYGQEFKEAVPVLQILIWASVFIFLSYIGGYLLNSINKQKIFTFITAFAAAINIILNLILISNYNYIGAAISTFITEGVVLVLIIYFVIKKAEVNLNYFQLIYKPILSGLIMGLAIYVFWNLHVIYIIILSSIIYFLMLYLIGGINKDDLNLIKSLKPRKKTAEFEELKIGE